VKILVSELISEHPNPTESQIVKLVFGTRKPDHQQGDDELENTSSGIELR
jgi:hypothetical protein